MRPQAVVAPWIRVSLLLLVPGGGSAGPALGAAHDDWRDVSCANGHYRYILFSPMRQAPVPAILLLHGAGGNPGEMVGAWTDLARREGIALVAPVLPGVAAFEAVAPRVFRCIVEDAGRSVGLDPRRIYVFGHSMGGYLAYDAAMLQSGFFAAVAVHAMGIAPDWDWIVDSAARRTPVAIYIGDRDPLVSLASVRRTRDLLWPSGSPCTTSSWRTTITTTGRCPTPSTPTPGISCGASHCRSGSTEPGPAPRWPR